MEQRLSVITIGADDLSVMKQFYGDTLGWKPVAENEDIVLFQMNGFLLSICGKKSLADFIGIGSAGDGFRRFTISYNVGTEEEVRTLYEELKSKVNILKEPAAPPFGGLFFYFTDPEENILEVACNPFVMLNESRDVVGHKSIDHL